MKKREKRERAAKRHLCFSFVFLFSSTSSRDIQRPLLRIPTHPSPTSFTLAHHDPPSIPPTPAHECRAAHGQWIHWEPQERIRVHGSRSPHVRTPLYLSFPLFCSLLSHCCASFTPALASYHSYCFLHISIPNLSLYHYYTYSYLAFIIFISLYIYCTIVTSSPALAFIKYISAV